MLGLEEGPALAGTRVTLSSYAARHVTNRRFEGVDLGSIAQIFLPSPVTELMDGEPTGTRSFLEDDNRGAIDPRPIASYDGLPFYLSIKGIGSTVEPFTLHALDRFSGAEAATDPAVRDRLMRARGPGPDRLITGELWLRGSPYGGQGLTFAENALKVSERADPTSIAGFRIAPLVHICFFPPALEDRLRSLHWYRRFRGRYVQEVRLVPSNVRVYFHSKQTLGGSASYVFDRFGVRTHEQAVAFEVHFVRSALAMMTLIPRTLRRGSDPDRFRALEFHDVWLDKDAVIAPDGTAFFVDLEGIEEVPIDRIDLRTRMEDQIFRSLYEFMFAFEQIDEERRGRFGAAGPRKAHFELIVREAIRPDPFLRLREAAGGAELVIRNACDEEPLNIEFPLVDR